MQSLPMQARPERPPAHIATAHEVQAWTLGYRAGQRFVRYSLAERNVLARVYVALTRRY